MKKSIALILFLFILFMAFAALSCSSSNNSPSNIAVQTDKSQVGQEPDSPEPTKKESENLPEMDMEGFELRFYNYDYSWLMWAVNELTAEEETGDLVLDEIYRRNRRVEDKYNCNIIETTVTNTNDRFKNIIRSGEDLYDIVLMYDEDVVGNYTQGFMHTWEKLPYLELDSPWWLQDANNVFKINNNQYATVGAFSLAMYSRGFILVFNKTMAADLGISENIYSLVRDGKWTFDKLTDIAKQAVSDLNGDGIMGQNDRYGVSTAIKVFFGPLITGAGVKYIDSNEEGDLYFAIPGNTYASDVMQKIYDLYNGNDIYYKIANDVHDGRIAAQGMFADQRILFIGTPTSSIPDFRAHEFDIGILPFPKYSEQQEKYYTLTSGAGVSVLPVSLSTDRFDNVGLVIEALARDSYQGVLPAYKETTLKTKHARDDDSADMLDIIFNSLTFDLGLSVFPYDTYYVYMENYLKMDNSFASTTEKLEGRVAEAIKKLIETSATE